MLDINLGMKFQVLRGNIASWTTVQNQAFPCGICSKKIMHESKYSGSEYFYVLWLWLKFLQEKNWRIKILRVWLFYIAVCQSSWMVFMWGMSMFHFELLCDGKKFILLVPMIYFLRSDSMAAPAQVVVKWLFYNDKCESNPNFNFVLFFRLWVYSKSLCKEEV